MDSTTPSANFHPQMVQYTPAESSIVKNVLALVSPSRSSLAFVRRKMRANLNLSSRAPSASSPAALVPTREVRFATRGSRSMARLSSRMRAEITSCWVESPGSRSSVSRQAASAELRSPACVARSAAAARRLSSSAWTRRWQDGHASSAAATSVPHWGHLDGAPRGASLTASGSGGRGPRGLIRSRHPERHAPVQLPGLVQRETGDEQMKRAADADHDRGGKREREQDDNSQEQRERSRPGVAGLRCRGEGPRCRGRGAGPTAARVECRAARVRACLDFLPQLARDQRRVRRHDRAVGEEHRQQLVAPATSAARPLPDRRSHEQADHDCDEAKFVARQCFDAEVDAGTERRRGGAQSQRFGETPGGGAAIPRRQDAGATAEARDLGVDLVVRSGNRLLADRARQAGSLVGALDAIELQAPVGGISGGWVGHGLASSGQGGGRGPNLWESNRMTQSETGSEAGIDTHGYLSGRFRSSFAQIDSYRYH